MLTSCPPKVGGWRETDRIRKLPLVGFLLVLCLATACGSVAASPPGTGGEHRPHQDLYFDSDRATRAVDSPAPSQLTAMAPSVPPPDSPPAPALSLATLFQQALPNLAPIIVAPPRNRLISADRSLDVGVGVYADCSGNSPIDRGVADIDPCFGGRTYFVGHAPGVFSPLLHMKTGSLITWYDSGAVAHHLRIVSRRDFRRNSQTLQLSQPDVVAQFQTCLTADGSLDLILDAVKA